MRKRVAEYLRDYSKKLDAELRDRKDRLARTDEKMAGLVDFIASGDRSNYIVTTLHDLETFANQEREAIRALERDAQQPLRLPSVDEVEAQVLQLGDQLERDPEAAKEQLRRWIEGGTIRVGPRDDGAIVAEGSLLPLMVIDDGQTPKRHLPETSLKISGRYTVVAGAAISRANTWQRFRIRL